jgi:hypothetical protein
VNAEGSQVAKGLVNQPVTGERGESCEVFRADHHVKMPAFGGACVAGMLGAVIADLESFGR